MPLRSFASSRARGGIAGSIFASLACSAIATITAMESIAAIEASALVAPPSVTAPTSRPDVIFAGGDESPAVLGPLRAREADPERLRRAESVFGAAARHDRIGPYALLTDRTPLPEAARWSAVAAGFDRLYAARYGVAPIDAPRETVVLFAREADYRTFLRAEPDLATIEATGCAGYGLVTLAADERPSSEVEETLVHELAHLASRRALGPALPPWLDEGIAEDLAATPFDLERGFSPGELRRDFEKSDSRIEIRGPLAALAKLDDLLEQGDAPKLGDLIEADWEPFALEDATLHYAEAHFFVRFLLDSGDASLESGFRSFLSSISKGGRVDRDALEESIGCPVARLEPLFRAWVRAIRAREYAEL